MENYEKWMLSLGKSITTVGIYLRSLRSIFNIDINQGIISSKIYPFGKRKYVILQSRNIKKALSLEDIAKIIDYEPQEFLAEEQARDFWLFSYYCNGMNIADIARLKYSDLSESKLVFIRQKTQHTTRSNQKPIVVMLLDEAKVIIHKWATLNFQITIFLTLLVRRIHQRNNVIKLSKKID